MNTSNEFGWCARGDWQPIEQRVAFNRPSLRQIYDALSFLRHYSCYWLRHLADRSKLFINTFEPLKHKPNYGVPCGTIGSGSIGRDFRGGFCKFSLRPGIVEQQVDMVKADQFILTLRQKMPDGSTTTVYQKVLCVMADPNRSSAANDLASWDFTFPPKHIAYRGLYPRSWTRYSVPEFGFALCIRQISPVIPHDYKASSLPTTVFVIDAHNAGECDLEVCVTFTFRNGTGLAKWASEGECNSKALDSSILESDNHQLVNGVCLEHTIDGMRCIYALAVRTANSSDAEVSYCGGFDPCGDGAKVWRSLSANGSLIRAKYMSANQLAVAVCAKRQVLKNSSSSACMEFVLAWDMPVVYFGQKSRLYRRRYTRFFGAYGQAATNLCAYALANYKDWELQIDRWQRPILDNPDLPSWYKSALFNELYYMSDGGSVWFEYESSWAEREPHLSEYTRQLFEQFGRFGYLESWEYRMLNTYDVHFYASYALAQLWPNLQHQLQAEFADQIGMTDDELVKFYTVGQKGSRKMPGRVPHDLGNPADEPWLKINAYLMHNTGEWKDLNLKFILTSCRDYFCVLNKDKKFLQKVWPTIKHLMAEALEHWDRDGDRMIENYGSADQTYDAWPMTGISAYCGSLWLATLRAASALAEEIDDSFAQKHYAETLTDARQVFEERLWNGEYYNFDEGSRSAETIMADQLCGYWFLQSISSELSDSLLPDGHVKMALDKIYNYNVLRFANGRLGAVNGMKKDGTVDRNYIQADEVWLGVTYCLAAFFIQQGDRERGFHTAWGCYDACFNRFGLQYQTPEALYKHCHYRAIGYMRPLGIWAMQWALSAQLKSESKYELHPDNKSGLHSEALIKPEWLS